MLQKGIKPTVFLLFKIGIPRVAAKSYLNGKAKSMALEHLAMLTIYFNCTPKEIFGVQDYPPGRIPKGHAMMEWAEYNLMFPMQDIREMSPKQIEEVGKAVREILERKD